MTSKKNPELKSLTVSQDAVAKEAYRIYLARNGTPGDPVNDWFQAERNVRASLQSAAAQRIGKTPNAATRTASAAATANGTSGSRRATKKTRKPGRG